MSRYFLSKPAKSSKVYFTWPIDMFIWCLTDWHDNDLPGQTNEGWQLVGQSPWQKLQTKAASTSCRSPPCHCFKCHGGDHSKQSNLIEFKLFKNYILKYIQIFYYLFYLLLFIIIYYLLLFIIIYYYLLLFIIIYYYLLLFIIIYYYLLLFIIIYYYLLLFIIIYYYLLLFIIIYYYLKKKRYFNINVRRGRKGGRTRGRRGGKPTSKRRRACIWHKI